MAKGLPVTWEIAAIPCTVSNRVEAFGIGHGMARRPIPSIDAVPTNRARSIRRLLPRPAARAHRQMP